MGALINSHSRPTFLVSRSPHHHGAAIAAEPQSVPIRLLGGEDSASGCCSAPYGRLRPPDSVLQYLREQHEAGQGIGVETAGAASRAPADRVGVLQLLLEAGDAVTYLSISRAGTRCARPAKCRVRDAVHRRIRGRRRAAVLAGDFRLHAVGVQRRGQRLAHRGVRRTGPHRAPRFAAHIRQSTARSQRIRLSRAGLHGAARAHRRPSKRTVPASRCSTPTGAT